LGLGRESARLCRSFVAISAAAASYWASEIAGSELQPSWASLTQLRQNQCQGNALLLLCLLEWEITLSSKPPKAGPKAENSAGSPSSSVQAFHGGAKAEAIYLKEIKSAIGSNQSHRLKLLTENRPCLQL